MFGRHGCAKKLSAGVATRAGRFNSTIHRAHTGGKLYIADVPRTRVAKFCALVLGRGPGVLGLTAEDRLRLGAFERPVAPFDLRLELTRCPAGMADEDPQTVHGFVAAEQLKKQLAVRAQVDALTSL